MDTHPYCELFPPMTREEYSELFTDMAQNGQIEPITVYQGKILDGRNRARACQELGREPKVFRLEGDDEKALNFVIARNLKRRHLTASQKAMVGQKSLKIFEEIARGKLREGNKKGGQESGRSRRDKTKSEVNLPQTSPKPRAPQARDQAAKAVGVSPSQIQRAKKVVECSPELAKQVVNGKISVNKALQKIAESDPEPARTRGRPKFDPDKRWAQVTVKLLAKEFSRWPNGSASVLATLIRKWADMIEKS